MLHRKQPEVVASSLANTAAGSFICGDSDGIMPSSRAHVYYLASASLFYRYSLDQDAWMQLPSPALAGTFGAGACGEFKALGFLGGTSTTAATAGTTTSITTAKNLMQSIKGSKVKCVAGAGAGYAGTVASNTLGANAVINVTPASGVAFDATSVFQVFSGSVWALSAGTLAAGSFRVYDVATNAWASKSITGLPATWGTCGQLLSAGSEQTGSFETGTSTGTNTTTTLNNTGKAWGTNCYANSQVRITAGTGLGQRRVIASNTATALTVAVAWTVTPDATSVYSIEGNDDSMYLLGNGAVTAYKYDCSADTWATLAPTAARAGAMISGGTADLVSNVSEAAWLGWTNTLLNQSATLYKQNGRYIYSLRGGGANTIDVYDVAANTWVAQGTQYGLATETFTLGSCSCYSGDYIYLMKENTGRVLRFNLVTFELEPWAAWLYGSGGTVLEGDKIFAASFVEGATKVRYLYGQSHTSTIFQRMLDVGA